MIKSDNVLMFYKFLTTREPQTSEWLASELKQIINELFAKKVIIAGIVCDNAAVNIATLNLLNGETKDMTQEQH